MTSPISIPALPVASQSLNVTLSRQNVRLDIFQRSTGLFMNVWLNGTMIVAGAICQDRNWIVRYGYLGLPGDLSFLDTQGEDDPTYDGIGSRYLLIYQEGQNAG